MFPARWLAAAALAALTTLGGCPTPSSTTTIPSANSTSQNDSSSSSSSSSSSGGPATLSFAQELEVHFPDCGEPIDGADYREQILEMVNQARAQAGLDPVRRNITLEQQAAQYACEMIQYDFFAHVNPVTGTTLADRSEEFGYDFLLVGENLAGGQRTPEQAFTDWMNSPDHRDNILEPRFTELGVGVREGGSLGLYWVQEFGLPAE